jgi:serine/threonine protein kinase/tetratricopeptide (TPR) repeat protein
VTPSLRDTLQQALGDAYRLERELGGGGMSRVFLATDAALDRRVVVKVIAPELAAGVNLERFKREIQVAARLQHPHIIPVLSAGQVRTSADDVLPYYVMPFVASESLRARLADRGPLSPSEVVSVLRDVAKALEYAHANGVVHRDIKPDNVLIAGTAAAVLDFGIAKALAAATAAGMRSERTDHAATEPSPQALTQLGGSIGTPAYMAPEQAAGDPAIDHRADFYALGCTAYELLTGQPPFANRSVAALFVAHLTEAPLPVASHRADVPPALATLVERCLAKDPNARPSAAADIVSALNLAAVEVLASAPRGSPTSTRADSRAAIAVLPFANLSPDANDEYFADGLTDELITDLSAIRTLRVTARGAVIRLKGSAKDHGAIARELGVRYVVTGSVRRAGGGIRVTASLHDANADAVLWTDKVNGPLGDVFAIQEQIAGRIAGGLRLTLSADEQRRLREHPVTDLRAYEYLLQARHALWTFATPALDRARLLLENALAIVGDNAQLYAALGQVHMNYIETGQPGAAEHFALVEHYAAKASDLDPESAPVLWLRGAIRWKHGEIRESIELLERARALDPSNAELITFLAYVYLLAGLDDRAWEAAEESTRLDPLTPLLQCMPGFCHWLAGRSAAALPYYQKFLAMDPTNPAAHLFLVVILGVSGNTDEAATRGESLQREFPGTIFGALGAAYAFAIRGRYDSARAAVTPELLSAVQRVEFIARLVAQLYVLIGDSDAAVDALEHSVRLGMSHYPFLSQRDPLLRTLHGHARFEHLLEVVRTRWERGGASAADQRRV